MLSRLIKRTMSHSPRMSFWHMSRLMDRIMEDYMREMARNENRVSPYWRDADHSILQVANEAHQILTEMGSTGSVDHNGIGDSMKTGENPAFEAEPGAEPTLLL
ncbi:hypothetical protein Y032_0017g3400 [Ancylostoma ceylanicum]|nr:hypothetical protein Y032_0017g3400 [Ancylostoma ceylanicum]